MTGYNVNTSAATSNTLLFEEEDTMAVEEYSSSNSYPYYYTYQQQQIIFWSGKISTVIGILGSLYIIYSIITNATRHKQVFQRLLCCCSCGHIVLILCIALGSIPMPRIPVDVGVDDGGSINHQQQTEQQQYYYRFGTTTSCQAMGAFAHVAFGFTLFYHAAAGFFYIFTFFRGWTERQFQTKIEPVLHITAIVYPLIGAIIGICTNMYGRDELLQLCWVDSTAKHRNYFILLSGLIELNYFTIFKQMALVGIAISVHRQEKRMKVRYSVTTSTQPAGYTTPQSLLIAKETLIQASIFFLSCSTPYALMMVMRYMDMFWTQRDPTGLVSNRLFGLAVAAQVLYPLQGIITMVGFIRPDYNKKRTKIGMEATFWQVLSATMKDHLGLSPSSPAIHNKSGRSSTYNTATECGVEEHCTTQRGTSSNQIHEQQVVASSDSSSTKTDSALFAKRIGVTNDDDEEEGAVVPAIVEDDDDDGGDIMYHEEQGL